MRMDDLRDFLELLEEFDEVQRIKVQVDWNLEMGAIMRRCYDVGAPAALFENVYPQRFGTLGAPLGASKERGHSLFARAALALSLRPSASAKEIMQTYLQRKENLIKPIVVGTSPCKENIMKGADVDVLKFPIPLIHGGDGERYIGNGIPSSPRIRIAHGSIGDVPADGP
jgi:UbiD family decarboxylase